MKKERILRMTLHFEGLSRPIVLSNKCDDFKEEVVRAELKKLFTPDEIQVLVTSNDEGIIFKSNDLKAIMFQPIKQKKQLDKNETFKINEIEDNIQKYEKPMLDYKKPEILSTDDLFVIEKDENDEEISTNNIDTIKNILEEDNDTSEEELETDENINNNSSINNIDNDLDNNKKK